MPIPQSFLSGAAGVPFTDAVAINNYFTRQNGHDFISWFNENIANKGFWGKSGNRAGVSIGNDRDKFNKLWSTESIQTVFGHNSVSLLQFLALQSIFNNETGGSLIPLTEKVGRPPLHPGIAYAFNKIPETKKRAYNTLSGNKTCFDLFNDTNYNSRFQDLPLGQQLKNTTNLVWKGEAYPLTISTSINPADTGYVLEADFYKFRGRGFIQTTGRTNYSSIIDFVMKYTGKDDVIKNMKATWAQRSTDNDILATASTNEEWDTLFQNTSGLIALKSVEVHNRLSGDYLGKLNGSDPTKAESSIRNMGKGISGGGPYVDIFLGRVTQIIELLQ